MDSTCMEAVYEDIKLKLMQDKESLATQKLMKLINENRKYYVIAAIDPDMRLYCDAVNETLIKMFNEAKTDALYCLEEARMKVQTIQVTLTKKHNEDIQSSMAKIENMINSDSYFGYLDVAQLGSSVISICNNALKEQKKNISEILLRIKKRLERNLNYMSCYRYPRFSASCLRKLKLIESSINNIDNINEYSSADQFEASHLLCDEISRELDSLELTIKKLEVYQQSIIMSLRFLKHSSISFSIVFFVGIFLLPFLTVPINSMFATFDISSISNAGSFQKTFLISGCILSIIISFLITAKKSL
jgi:hypothetical protein